MIHHVYIIKRSGECLFSKSYGAKLLDEGLISGFLSALQSFVTEVSGEVIKIIRTGNIKFIYGVARDLIFVLATSEDEDEELTQQKITTLKEEFIKKFEKEIDSWNGDVSVFTSFSDEIDKIILGPIKISLVGSSGVGKTTIFKLIKGEETPIEHDPTIFVDIGGVKVKIGEYKIPLRVWDFGGQDQFKKAWDRLVQASDIVLLILDSSIVNVLKTRKDLMKLMDNISKNTQIIGIANKQDMPGAVKPELVKRVLGIKTYGLVGIDPSNRKILLQIIGEAIEKWFETRGVNIKISKIETEQSEEEKQGLTHAK